MAKRILIIDDDQQLCEELSDFLSMEGFSVYFSTCPARGKDMLFRDGCDILLLDLKMPKIDGLQLLELIVREIQGVKVMVMSGNLEVRKLIDTSGYSRHVVEVFSKPFDMFELLKKINELTGSE